MQAGGVGVTGDGPYVDPRWNWPEYPDGAVVQLLVHGVGGEGPEGMTRDAHPVRVGGDDGVGFWRARNPRVPSPLGPTGTTPHADADPESGTGHVREVVSWGGSTSGRSRSAFWVLLLPFALLNAAGRMARPGADDRTVNRHQSICRLLSLTMTVGFVALTMAAVVDLVALQCGAQPICAEADLTGGWVLAPLRWFPDDAAALVALLSLLPVLAVYLLRAAGRAQLTGVGYANPVPTLSARPAQRLDEPTFWANRWPAWRLRGLHITAGYAWATLVLGLVLPPLLPDAPSWLGTAVVAVALASLLGNAVLVALPRVAGSAPDTRLATSLIVLRAATLVALGWIVGTALALPLSGLTDWGDGLVLRGAAGLLVVVAGWMHVRNIVSPGSKSAGPSGAARDLLLFAGMLAAAVATAPAGATRVTTVDALRALAAGPDPLDHVLGGAPAAVYAPLLWLVAVQIALVVALAWVSYGRADRGAPLHGPDRDAGVFRPGRGPLRTAAVPRNLGAPVVALLSLLLVTAVAGGIHGAVLDWLGCRVASHATVADAIAAGPVPASDPCTTDAASDDASPLEPAVRAVIAPRTQVPLALPWWLPWTALVVAVTILLVGLAAGTSWLIIRLRPPPDELVREAMARSLAAPVPDLADGRAGARAAVTAATGRAWGLRVLTEHGGLALLWAVLLPTVAVAAGAVVALVRGPFGEPPLVTLWLFGLAALPGLAVAAVRTAREDRAARREFARLWDVLAFWPRLTHPFSPPSYAEALVPALTARVRTLTDLGHPVVLGGHSQGSVVNLATVLQLGPVRQPLHLLTYGSPLRLLYEGFFPHVFGGPDGAIARATPEIEDPDAEAAATTGARPRSVLSTWHNVMALTEPIGTPLWGASVRTEDLDPEGRGSWDVLLALPWHRCPACCWYRPPATGPVAPADRRAAVDCTITDPDRAMSPAGEVDGTVAGHASYHRSRELDLHLQHLAATIGSGGTDGVAASGR